MDTEDVATGIMVFIFGFLIIAIVALLLAWVTMVLWNWLMPDIFGLKLITFWQAFGLNLLTGVLFKNSSSSTTKKD
jgi:hypothetical protein